MPSYCYWNCEWWRRYFWVVMSVIWFDLSWSSQLMELHNINDWDYSLWREQLSLWVLGFAFLFFLHLPFYSIIIHQMNWNPELQVIVSSKSVFCRYFAVCQMFLADETSRLQRGQFCTFCCRAGIAVLCNLALSCLNMQHLKKMSTSINHLKHLSK